MGQALARKAELKMRFRFACALAGALVVGTSFGTQVVRLDEKAKWLTLPASNNFARVPSPAEWAQKNLRYDAKKVHCEWKRREFALPPGWESDRLRLDFWRIDGNAIVFVNGRRAGEALGPYCEVDFTGLAHAGTNVLEVFVTRNYTGVSRTAESDVLRSGSRGPKGENWPYDRWPLGISGPIDVIRLPRPAAVTDVFVKTSVRKWEIEAEVEVDASQDGAATVSCRILDAKGATAKTLPSASAKIRKGVNKVVLKDAWKDPKLWDVGQPNLYKAVVSVCGADGREIDAKTVEFGFREVWTEGRSVYLNGHVQRFRVEGSWFGLTRNSVGLLQALGRNMILDQPHPNKWWYFAWWKDCAILDAELLWVCDNYGICLQEPVPTVNRVVPVFHDPRFKAAYADETLRFMRRYRNHPSIILWAISMNFINPKSGIHPDQLGQRATSVTTEREAVCDWALAKVKELDPTRLVYTHADGNVGDIASGNCYPNITPVQEVADYLEIWREKGDMPYLASEYDAPYDLTCFKANGRPAIAEIAAINMGPRAYDGVAWSVQTNLASASASYNMHCLKDFADADPVFWSMEKGYVEATDRAWRMDGATGWHHFHGASYGNPVVQKKRGGRVVSVKIPYNKFETPFSGRPEWLSSNFYIHAANMQDLLAFIGGHGRHTDKTHVFRGGETIEKSLCLVWDGARPLKIGYELVFSAADGKNATRVDAGSKELKPGDICQLPVSFPAPQVKARTDYRLSMKVTGFGDAAVTDSIDLTVFPAAFEPLKTARRVKLYDPAGKSAWVLSVVKDATALAGEPGTVAASLDPAKDLLVVGREALRVNGELPYRPSDVAKGLKVVVLEQQPDVWEAWGFNCIEPMPRKVFAGVGLGAGLFKGLKESDLSYWRGESALYPAFKLPRPKDFSPHPKGSNRHGLASTVFATPTEPGILPLLTAEFDLAYSPLLLYREGKGAVVFSSLDLAGRADGTDPAAQAFAKNLFACVDSLACDQSRRVKVNYGTRAADTDKFLGDGGLVLNVGFGTNELAKCGVKAEMRRTMRPVPEGELALFAERRLTYFRAFLDYAAITEKGACTEGLWFRRGNECFLQVDPGFFRRKFAKSQKELENTVLSSSHLHDLVSRAVTYLGAEPSPALKGEMASIRHKPGFENLATWHVIGPYWTNPALPVTNRLDIVHSAEAKALAGDLNPNFVYPNERGKNLDFRTSVTADGNNCVDFKKAFPDEQVSEASVAYAIKTIHSDTERDALLRLGFDWYMKVYLNGELVVDWSAGLGCNPRANMKRCVLHLKKGDNTLVFKARAGAGGFCFWANLSEPGLPFDAEASYEKPPASPLYEKGRGRGGEYFYTYW